MRIVLLGPPGAGKGTQAKTLAERLRVPHVASGDLFRQHQAENTPLGRQVRYYTERGDLVPDQLTIRMVLERLGEADCAGGYILDGFPRTLEQARALDSELASRGQELDVALSVEVPEEELVRRLSGRLICRQCQAPYHRDNAPPRRPGVCDRCGGELYQRPDDQPEVVRQRFRVYLAQTAPLAEHYRVRGKLKEVDGQGSIEEVEAAMMEAVQAGLAR
ncbi:MAG: adenylate kinase [Chloroflexi bacterium]|nr:adenylate kinase [Chloroflexota bacterium]